MENFIYTWQIEDSVCDGLIDYFHQNNEHKSDGTISLYNESKIRKDIKESTDVMFYNQSKDERILNYFNCLRKGHAAYCDKYNLWNMKLNTHMGNNIQYYPPGGGYKQWHYERANEMVVRDRVLVYMTYLNNVDNGGTEWLFQNYKTEAKKGLSVIWPAEWTHTHKGTISQQEKYIATGWYVFQ
jgi:hypothetical protein